MALAYTIKSCFPSSPRLARMATRRQEAENQQAEHRTRIPTAWLASHGAEAIGHDLGV